MASNGYNRLECKLGPLPDGQQARGISSSLSPNMDVAIMLRIERFRSPFFTVISPSSVLPHWERHDSGYMPADLQQEIQGLTNPVAPSGSALETKRGGLAVPDTPQGSARPTSRPRSRRICLRLDLLEASLWLDVRKQAGPEAARSGRLATAAWLGLPRGACRWRRSGRIQ